MFVFLNPVLAAPTSPIAGHHHEGEQWWMSPCHPIELRNQTRHGRSADKHQIKIFMYQTNLYLKEFKTMYNSVSFGKFSTSSEALLFSFFRLQPGKRVKFTWLKVNKLLCDMERCGNVNIPFLSKTNQFTNFDLFLQRLQGFFETLQIFAIYMEHLKNVQIKSETSDSYGIRRREIYQNASEHLKLVLCEYEEVLHNKHVPYSVIDKTKVKLKYPHKVMDSSEVKMTDFGFFFKLRKFIKGGRKRLKNFKGCNKKQKRKKNNSLICNL